VTCRSREGLRLAVQLYAGTPEHYMAVLKAAEEFSGWLEHCPPDPSSGDLAGVLAKIINNEERIMSQQSDIDAATAALTALTGDVATNVSQLVNTDVPAIQAALSALQGQGVDTSALDAAVAAASGTASSLDSAVSGVTALTTPAETEPPAAG
jgi:hypothetical protein